MDFNQLPLSAGMLKSIQALGYQSPSPIQEQAIPLLMEGKDIIGQAKTGTGKTAAFGIPLIERVDPQQKTLQALVMCPSRELAIQVTEELRKLAKHESQLFIAAVYGGEPMFKQLKMLKRRPQIIVATPGRLLDHLERKSFNLKAVQAIVLDEADEMLNMGFRDDIEYVLYKADQPRQTVFFSATMTRTIMNMMEAHQNDPVHIEVAGADESSKSEIEQFYMEVSRKQKLKALLGCMESHQPKLGLVFCNTRTQVDELVSQLQSEGCSVDGLHGGMSQSVRNKVMQRFRTGRIRYLVATDVAARGIDVHNIQMVFNYDFPKEHDNYIHRIGRTGRAGKSGKAISFIDARQLSDVKKLRHRLGVTLDRYEPATAVMA